MIDTMSLVASGADLLDGLAYRDAAPANWRERIDVSEIDMASTERCVAAQVFGHWNDAPLEVALHAAFGGGLDRMDYDEYLQLVSLGNAWAEYLVRTA